MNQEPKRIKLSGKFHEPIEPLADDRKSVLLRAAYDLLKQAKDDHYVRSAISDILTYYDGAECDGHCLMTDIANELGLDEGTAPLS